MALGIGMGIGLCFGGVFTVAPVVGSASASKTGTTEITFTVNISPSSAYAGVEWGVNPTYTWTVFDAAAGSSHTLIIGSTDGVVVGTTYIWRPYATNDPLDAPASRVYGTGGTISMGGVAAPTLTGSPTLLASWDFDRADLVTLSGSDIDQIAGADGTSYTLLTPGNMPTQATRGGKNVARFTAASSQYMQIASACGVDPAVGCSIVIVAELATTITNQNVFEIADSSVATNRNRYNHQFVTGSTGLRSRKSAAAASADAQQGSAFSAAKYCYVGRFSGGTGTITHYIDGESVGDTSASVADPGALTHTTLGAIFASATLSNYLDGWIWRVLVYAGDFGTTAAEEAAAWSSTNYGTTNTV